MALTRAEGTRALACLRCESGSGRTAQRPARRLIATGARTPQKRSFISWRPGVLVTTAYRTSLLIFVFAFVAQSWR